MMFLKGVLNSSSLYPISFAQSSPLLTSTDEPEGRHSILTKKLLFWGHLKFQFYFDNNQLKWPIAKKTCEAAHLLGEVNRNYQWFIENS
jgi:hypothetical protein